VCSPEDPI
jgi:ABC-type multidrug transport system ATPase subunit